jgi:hypothetical protein
LTGKKDSEEPFKLLKKKQEAEYDSRNHTFDIQTTILASSLCDGRKRTQNGLPFSSTRVNRLKKINSENSSSYTVSGHLSDPQRM